MKKDLVESDAVVKLFESLLGRRVQATPAAALALEVPNAHLVAEYGSSQGALGSLCICELGLACSLGAALSMLPAELVAESVTKGRIDGPLADNFQEMANVLATVFHQPERPQLNLSKLHFPGAPLPAGLSGVMQGFPQRLDLELDVAGYGGGRISLLYR